MNFKKPLFSVVIPCYNYGHVIERAVLSVISQTCDDYELLVINDGSTDNSESVINLLKKRYTNLQVMHNVNQGPAATRNCGIRNTSGKYLIFLDADDELLVDALENFKKYHLTNPDVMMIVGGHLSVDIKTGKEKHHLPKLLPDEREACFKGYLLDKTVKVSNGSTAMHRDLFESYLYPEQFRNSEDIPMFAYIFASFKCGALIKEINRIYKHSGSLRNNLDYAMNIGVTIVDEVFDPKRIDDHLSKYKKQYFSQRCLSLFRTLVVSDSKEEARKYYIKAVATHPSNILKISYLSKFIMSFLR